MKPMCGLVGWPQGIEGYPRVGIRTLGPTPLSASWPPWREMLGSTMLSLTYDLPQHRPKSSTTEYIVPVPGQLDTAYHLRKKESQRGTVYIVLACEQVLWTVSIKWTEVLGSGSWTEGVEKLRWTQASSCGCVWSSSLLLARNGMGPAVSGSWCCGFL